MHEPHGDQLEALLFESLQDLSDQTALDAVGLDHDEGPLLVSIGSHGEEVVGAVSRKNLAKKVLKAIESSDQVKEGMWTSSASKVFLPVGTDNIYTERRLS